jgi:periplasmic divalent cation tolerance protein
MVILIYITADSEKEAEGIASALLDESLIACANIFPIKSLYRWEGKVKKSQEFALILKTSEAQYETVESKIKEMHSYEVPCVVSIPVNRGNKEYIDWILKNADG